MRVFGIAGHSGMGKTTLLERVLPYFQAQGLKVSAIKHSHKDLEIDRAGKDSYRLRESGYQEILVTGRRRWVLMHELSEDQEPTLERLLENFQPCDQVLIEGFKQGNFPKLEVWREAVGKSTLWPGIPGIAGIATDDSVAASGLPIVALSDIAGIANFIFEQATDVCADSILTTGGADNLRMTRVFSVKTLVSPTSA